MINPTVITIFYLTLILTLLIFSKRRGFWLLNGLIFPLPFLQTFIHLHYLVIFGLLSDFLLISPINLPKRYLQNLIHTSLILFFVVCLISALIATDWKPAIAPIIELVYYYTYFRLVLKLFWPEDRKLVKWSVGVFAMAFILSVAIQFLQIAGVESFNVYSADKLNQNTQISSIENSIRYWGPFGNALTHSCYLAIGGVFLFIMYVQEARKLTRTFGFFVIVITIVGIVFTISRTALLSVIIIFPLYVWMISKGLIRGILLIIVTVLIATMSGLDLSLNTGNSLTSRLVDSQSDFKEGRLALWIKGWEVFQENPFFGTGPGNLSNNLKNLQGGIFDFSNKEDLQELWGHVENVYLTILYTFGVSGFALFVYVLISITIKLYHQFMYPSDSIILQRSLFMMWIVTSVNMLTNPAMFSDPRLTMVGIFFLAVTVKSLYQVPIPNLVTKEVQTL